MKVSRSAYCAWLKRPAEIITLEKLNLYRKATHFFEKSRNSLGYQELENVIEADKCFSTDISVTFVFVGSGAYVNELKFLAHANKLSNVFFKPLQPRNKVKEMLAMADLHLVIQRKGAADAVLLSKLTNILSAGGYGIVTAEGHTELGQIA